MSSNYGRRRGQPTTNDASPGTDEEILVEAHHDPQRVSPECIPDGLHGVNRDLEATSFSHDSVTGDRLRWVCGDSETAIGTYVDTTTDPVRVLHLIKVIRRSSPMTTADPEDCAPTFCFETNTGERLRLSTSRDEHTARLADIVETDGTHPELPPHL